MSEKQNWTSAKAASLAYLIWIYCKVSIFLSYQQDTPCQSNTILWCFIRFQLHFIQELFLNVKICTTIFMTRHEILLTKSETECSISEHQFKSNKHVWLDIFADSIMFYPKIWVKETLLRIQNYISSTWSMISLK